MQRLKRHEEIASHNADESEFPSDDDLFHIISKEILRYWIAWT